MKFWSGASLSGTSCSQVLPTDAFPVFCWGEVVGKVQILKGIKDPELLSTRTWVFQEEMLWDLLSLRDLGHFYFVSVVLPQLLLCQCQIWCISGSRNKAEGWRNKPWARHCHHSLPTHLTIEHHGRGSFVQVGKPNNERRPFITSIISGKAQ